MTSLGAFQWTSKSGHLYLNNQRVSLKGASWFGFETGLNVFHGLWAVDYKFLLDFLAHNRFNAMRIPFSLDMVLHNPAPSSINFGGCQNDHNCNLDLKGLSSLQVLDKMIAAAAQRGIAVMLDLHSFEPDAYASNGLWYDSSHPESLVVQGWQMLASRYSKSPNVFAADLKNEPFLTTWAEKRPSSDWDAAASRLGNNITSQTDWLIFVEGTANSPPCPDPCFYGENLRGVRSVGVRLNKADKLVYSPHVYGPNVYQHPYFNDPSFPNNMKAIWDDHFGYIRDMQGPAVVLGEWGGALSGKNGVWMNALVDYLLQKDMTDQFFWCLNPNSGDTGGLVLDDWITPDQGKLNLLARLVPNPTRFQF